MVHTVLSGQMVHTNILFSQGHGIHHGPFCSVASKSNNRQRGAAVVVLSFSW